MKLSVCCITYNQEKFISQAIEGMLAQETNFDVEIVIGDDASTDNTGKICENFLKRYPDKIRLLSSKKNLGMNVNFERSIKACKGKYIALCEGDDYWIDNHKLQKQVDFLEANPDFSICCHRVYDLYGKKNLKLETSKTSEVIKEYTIDDLTKGNFLNTVSVVYRNGLFKDFPSWFSESPVGDYVLHMLNAQFGKIKYLPDVMAVYRRHGKGLWSMKSREFQTLNIIKVIDFLITHFEGRIQELLIKQKASIYSELARLQFYEQHIEKATGYLKKAFENDPSLRDEWLTNEYPNLILNIYNSRKFKVINKLSLLLQKFRTGTL